MTDTLLRFRGAMGNSPLQGHAATPPVQALNAGAAPFVLGSPIPAIPTPPPVENDVLIDSESILRILRDATAAADTGSADGGDGKVAATTTPQQLPVPTTSFAQLGSSFSKNMTTDEAPLFGSSMWGSTSAYPAVPHSTPAPYSVSPTVGQGPAAILVRNSHGIFLLQPAIGSPMPGPSYSAPAALQQQQASPPLAPPTVAAHHHHNHHHHQHAHTSFGRGVSSTYRSPQAGGAAAPPPPTYMSALRDCNPDETPGSLASNIPMGAPSFALNRTAAIPVQRNNASPALGASPPPYHGGGASFGR